MFNIHAIIILIRSIFHALDKYKIHQIQSRVLLKISQDASWYVVSESKNLNIYVGISWTCVLNCVCAKYEACCEFIHPAGSVVGDLDYSIKSPLFFQAQ